MFILCTGKMAKECYNIPYTEVQIYTLEELSYYIYNNIYNINEDFFQADLIVWIRDGLDHRALAEKLQELLADKAPNIKDIVVTVLCATDYYKEDEIKKLIEVMDNISHLPHYERKKMKVDTLLMEGQYGKAAAAYRKLLNGSLSINFTPEEYGNILHNLGVAEFYISSFYDAARNFKEAYVRNGKLESLYEYLLVLLIQGKEGEFENEALSMDISFDKIKELKKEYADACEEMEEATFDTSFVEQCKTDLRKAFAL